MKDASVHFIDGFSSSFRGLKALARTRRLWPYALAPFVIGAALLGVGLSWAFTNLGPWINGWATGAAVVPEALRSTVYWLVVILLWPVCLVAIFYGVFIATKILAAPFHALLAERALMEFDALQDRPFQFGPWVRVSVRMLRVSIVKALLFAVLGLFLFAVSFVPVLNVFAAFGFLLIVAFDSTDYSFEALQMGFRDRLGFFRRHFFYFCGLAASLGLVFFIPGFNFFLFPAAVVGGSDLVSRRLKTKSERETE
ncbi:MAG: EI24 domain-containing protein [Bdellovibrionaceae bacterium]|nr:EI24 domain-containing protein [Pseudobdellovibrionaceae bacterium]